MGHANKTTENEESNNTTDTVTRVEISKISGSGGAIALNVKDGKSFFHANSQPFTEST